MKFYTFYAYTVFIKWIIFLDCLVLAYINIVRGDEISEMRIFDARGNISGQKVAEWNETFEVNPEELGEYIQGDIILPLEVGRNGIILQTYRWPNGIIPYEITGNFTSEERKRIQKVIKLYRDYTCIKFRLKTPRDEDWMNIDNSYTGCWTSVGKRGGKQTVNLQTPNCLYRIGTVIHEFLHIIGFFHEQSRWDRDDYVTVEWKNIRRNKKINFVKLKDNVITNFGVSYDYDSVMHYSSHAFSKTGNPTILPKNKDAKIGQRERLSTKDIEKIYYMYNCIHKNVKYEYNVAGGQEWLPKITIILLLFNCIVIMLNI